MAQTRAERDRRLDAAMAVPDDEADLIALAEEMVSVLLTLGHVVLAVVYIVGCSLAQAGRLVNGNVDVNAAQQAMLTVTPRNSSSCMYQNCSSTYAGRPSKSRLMMCQATSLQVF